MVCRADPVIEAVHLLQQLSHADQQRAQQLEQWKQLCRSCAGWWIPIPPQQTWKDLGDGTGPMAPPGAQIR